MERIIGMGFSPLGDNSIQCVVFADAMLFWGGGFPSLIIFV
jgi:hypothetical protein